LPPPSQNLQKLSVPNPLSIKSSTNIRISEDRDSVNCNKPQSNRNSHPTKKKNLTSFNVTDCDVTFTNNNMDISPIYVPKSSYHEQMNIKNRKESEANNNPNSNGNNNKNNSNNNNNNNNNNHKIFNNNIAFMKTNSLNLVNKSCFTLKTRESRVISQENFAFLKKNLEDFFRNRPKEDFQQDFQPNYIASDSQEQEDPPFLNISVIELESNSKEEFKNENFPNNTMKKEEYRNQLILLTQEILKDSQESSFPKEEIGFHMFNAFENEINWVLSKDEEDMLMKYAKLWHQLSNCYQDLGLWTECLNCLLPLATLYYQLGLTKQLNVCQIDAYLIQIMLILSQNTNKKNVINGDSKEIQRNSMLLCFIEEKLKNEKNLEEMKPVLSFLRFFQGVLTKNFELCKEVLRDFEGLHMVTCEEYQDLFDFVVFIYFFYFKFDFYIFFIKNLKENSLKKLKWLLKIEEMDQITKQIFKEFLIERVQLFKEKTLKNWDRAYGLKIPFKHKEISKLLVKMGNLLRIWLDLPHQAIFFYESAYKFDPKCLKALFFIALTLRSIGKSSLALEFYSQALKYNRNFVDCYFNSGNIYFEDLMNLKEAEKAYKEALFRYSEAKDPPLVNVGRIFNLLAEVKYQNQEYKTAVLLNVQG